MGFSKSVNVLLAVVILTYSIDCAPMGTICGSGEPLPERNNAERFDDALQIVGKFVQLQILNKKVVNEELNFYQHMQSVAEAALSAESHSDNSREGQAFREVMSEIAREACTWITGLEGSGMESTSVNCSNLTDIVRFTWQKEVDFIMSSFPDMNISTNTLSLSLRLRPILLDMQDYLRSNSMETIQPDEEYRRAWVTQNISPANRCLLCRAAS